MTIFENAMYASSSDMNSMDKTETNYVIIGDEIERKTGFARGSMMSILINDLKKIKETQPDIKVAIKNTTEDLDFYSQILRKLPDVYFMFDQEYAKKYSKHSTDEWLQLANNHNSF